MKFYQVRFDTKYPNRREGEGYYGSYFNYEYCVPSKGSTTMFTFSPNNEMGSREFFSVAKQELRLLGDTDEICTG